MNLEEFNRWCVDYQVSHQRGVAPPRPIVMGIINVTPDSFSDGGNSNQDDAVRRAQAMVESGADMLDIGGEATNPYAESVSVEEELARVIPVIKAIRSQSDICISIDTSKSAVMQSAIDAGADFINDITALSGEGALFVAKKYDAPACLMHMKGTPKTMQIAPQYGSVVDDVDAFFGARINACVQYGLKRERLILDPGFGFGKTVSHNLVLLKRISAFKHYGLPILLGVSRKSTLGAILKTETMGRLVGGLAASVYAVLQGVSILRTHDVFETHQALQMISAIVDINESGA